MTTKNASKTPSLAATKAEGRLSEEQLDRVSGGWPIDWGPVKPTTTTTINGIAGESTDAKHSSTID